MTRTSISYQLDNEDSTVNQNNTEISNTDDIHSCAPRRKIIYSAQAKSTPPLLTPLNTTLTIAPVELHRTTKLALVGKEYLCFQIKSKYPHAAQCFKSRILNKAIDYILSIDTFEQECVVIKGMLKSSRIENNMKTIGIYQSSFTRSSFEHICMNNIKKIYQHAGKCDDEKISRILLMMLYCLLQRESQIKVLM